MFSGNLAVPDWNFYVVLSSNCILFPLVAFAMSSQISTSFTIETEQEDDGRWIAEILEISGALVYGDNQQQAVAHVKALALYVIADKQNHGEADFANS